MIAVSQKLFSDNFGNYLLHGMDEIFLSSPITWWPQTIGWKVLGVVAVLMLVRWFYHRWVQWKGNAYRRVAIREIQRLQNSGDEMRLVASLPKVLKATALHAYPRSSVAKLSGEAWLQELDECCDRTRFNSSLGQSLLKLSYREVSVEKIPSRELQELIEMVIEWIRHHTAVNANLADKNT